MSAARTERIRSRARNPKWQQPPLRIEMLECINCDACLRHCPPQFGAIFNHGPDVIIIPELCSGCDKCLPACPVNCIYPFSEWQAHEVPADWWEEPLSANDPYAGRAAIIHGMTSATLPGAEPWSHVGGGDRGAVVLHGFTGNPSSMRGVAEAFAAKDFHVELPRLPGHGTVVDDMLATRWADWAGEAEAAYQRLGERASHIVVVGLSMGGALALRVGADHAEIDGLVCINPVAQPQTPEIIEMLRGLVAGGTAVLPGIGSDIADPNARESAYEGTPVEPLLSMLLDGIEPLSRVYSDIHIPLLLMNSPQDHVVEPAHSEFLADRYGGPVQRVTLERSYHVATQDYDKELIVEATAEFATRVVAGR